MVAEEKVISEAVPREDTALFYCPADVRILIIDDETAICKVI